MNLTLLLPEIIVIVGGLAVMLRDLWLPADRKDGLWAWALAVPLIALAATFLPQLDVAARISVDGAMIVNPEATALSGSFYLDGMSMLLKRAFCVAAALVILMSREYLSELNRGQGEFWSLALFALSGMFFCASANDFMSLFVALEVVTVSFFVLVAFKRSSGTSIEAGLKLLVMGSLSAALMLYGIAFVYGASGTVFFDQVVVNGEVTRTGLRDLLATGQLVYSTELLIGVMLIFLGLGFKTSAVPLHVWVPDVYQGAPTPVTAYLSVGSKLAGFVLMLRVLEVFSRSGPMVDSLTPFLALVAAVTLFYGNLGALPQSNIKRLLGYSSIGQCGYILLGIASAWTVGISGTLFYMTAYVVTNLAAFAVVILVSRATNSHEIDDYSGLGRKNPLLAAALTVALLSLAGVPPFIGFFGKFMLIGSTFGSDELRWLGLVGMVNVVIALYYYLCVIKRIYMREERHPAKSVVPLRLKVVLAISMAALVIGGIAPQFLADKTAEIAEELQFAPRPRGGEHR